MKKVLNQGVMTSVQRWGWGGVGEGSPETVSKAAFACVHVCAHACVRTRVCPCAPVDRACGFHQLLKGV